MKTVLIFLTEGYADWEAALVAAELQSRETGYQVRTVALDTEPKKSMGGLRVLPDAALEESESNLGDVAMLIIPGGVNWHVSANHQVTRLVDACRTRNIPVAAICDAVTMLADKGYLDHVRHTGNTLPYLKHFAANYRGEALFVEAQAVADGGFITANGTASLEFTREILRALGVTPALDQLRDVLAALQITEQEPLDAWYSLWKRGIFPRQ